MARRTVPFALALVVTPAAGVAAQPALPAGASATRIVLDSVDLTGVTTLGELLQGRAPGLLVQSSSGLAGSGTTLASRGRRSAGLVTSDAPLLVVDGVRVVDGQDAIQVDGTLVTSRYDDLPVEQLATVDVLPGPAAAARYGPGASAGAIVVTTRRATPGRTERRAYADLGAGAAGGARPVYFRGVGTSGTARLAQGCTIDLQALGGCAFTRAESVRPYDAAGWTTGGRARAGARLAGGSDRARYTLGLDGARLAGPVQGSDAARGTFRAGADFQPARTLRVTLGAGLLAATTDAPVGGLASRVVLDVNRPLGGYTPPATSDAEASLRTRRLDASAAAEWTVRPWLTARGTASTSRSRQTERAASTVTFGPSVTYRDDTGAAGRRVGVFEVGASAAYRAAGAALSTDLTVQQVADRTSESVESRLGTALPVGSTPVNTFGGFGRLRDDVRGVALAQRLDAGRLRAGATVRADQVGADRARATTGSADFAVRLLGAPNTPNTPNAPRGLTLRGAVGTAVGRASLGAVFPAGDPTGGARFPFGGGGVGGPDQATRPRFERTREAEVGLDARFGRGVTAAVTAYDQRTRDALLPAQPVFVNAVIIGYRVAPGVLGNRGVEASLRARLVERPGAALALGLRAWANRDRVLALEAPPLVMPAVGGVDQVVRPGDALGALLGVPGSPRARDYDGDGRVTSQEAARARDEAVQAVGAGARRPVVGSPVPTRTLALDAQGRLGARLRVSALAEYQGGRRALGDGAPLFAAARGSVDPAAPLAEQARAASVAALPEGLLERADFLRLREVSLVWRLSRGAGEAGGRGTTVTLAGRNLLTATGFSGLDPEAGAGGWGPGDRGALYAVPVARTVALRVTAGW